MQLSVAGFLPAWVAVVFPDPAWPLFPAITLPATTTSPAPHHNDRIHITSGPRKEVEDAPADIWYFAFGSNLADSVLRGRRSITPAETVGARLPGYRLAFTLQALPYREPAMASVERIPTESPPVSNGAAHAADAAGARRRGPAGAEPWSQGPEKGGAEDRQEVHGALYRLTQGQWDYICETEGAAGSKQSDYEILEVEAEAYDGRRIEARTLTTSERALRFRNVSEMEVHGARNSCQKVARRRGVPLSLEDGT